MGMLWDLIEEHRQKSVYTPSVRQFAARAGIGNTTLSAWKEIRKLPEPDHLRRVAAQLRVPYAVVLDAALHDAGYLGGDSDDRDAAAITRARGSLAEDPSVTIDPGVEIGEHLLPTSTPATTPAPQRRGRG